METMYTGYGIVVFSPAVAGAICRKARPLYWPVRYQEMDTRREAFYSAGGVGGTGGAPNGNTACSRAACIEYAGSPDCSVPAARRGDGFLPVVGGCYTYTPIATLQPAPVPTCRS